MKRPPALPLVAAIALAGCAAAAEPVRAPVAPPPPPAPAPAAAVPRVPSGMQWLYGSGEAAASSLQTYRAFTDYVVARAHARPAQSVVLETGSTLEAPHFVPCGQKPPAVVLDVDETVIQNLGVEYDDAMHPGRPYDQSRWERWEQTGLRQVAPIPGVLEALHAARAAGVTVIFNSNRMASNAASTEQMLEAAGVGPARHGETLFLQGDAAPGSGKDPRRAAIAGRYCVIAMAGDQLGDFSDLFNARTLGVPSRRAAAASAPFASLWGNGWFMLSNPVYGPSLRGDFDDIFPAGKRWSDPQGANE